MFQFRSDGEREIEQERRRLIWEMLTAQLTATHERLMAQYGMEVLRPVDEESDSVLRPRRKRINYALPAADTSSHPAPRSGPGRLPEV